MEPFAGSLTHLAGSLNVEAVALNQQTLAAMDQQLASLSDGGAAYSMLQQPPYYSSPSTAERQVCLDVHAHEGSHSPDICTQRIEFLEAKQSLPLGNAEADEALHGGWGLR